MSALDELSFNPTTALPRSNGELLFGEPWESRAFGMAAALADQGVFSWSDFQAGLIAAIADHEGGARAEETFLYYEHWLSALEKLAIGRGLVTPEDIDARVAEFQCRPQGHDHDHGHNHHDDEDHHRGHVHRGQG